MLTIFESVDSKQPSSMLTESSRSATQCPISLEGKVGLWYEDQMQRTQNHKEQEESQNLYRCWCRRVVHNNLQHAAYISTENCLSRIYSTWSAWWPTLWLQYFARRCLNPLKSVTGTCRHWETWDASIWKECLPTNEVITSTHIRTAAPASGWNTLQWGGSFWV